MGQHRTTLLTPGASDTAARQHQLVQGPPKPKPDAPLDARPQANASGSAALGRARPAPAKPAAPRHLGFTQQPADAPSTSQPASDTSQQADAPIVTEEMQIAAATLASAQEGGPEACESLRKLLQNVVRCPGEAKYRQMKRCGLACLHWRHFCSVFTRLQRPACGCVG